MNVTPTRYTIEHDGYTTVASLSDAGWTVITRPDDVPDIPPYMNILTVEGWKPVINNTHLARSFESIGDVCHFIKENS